MALKPRHQQTRRWKSRVILPWEGSVLERYASEAQYVGSPEHKDYVNPILSEAPRPRAESDCSRCEQYPAEVWPAFTASLRAAMRAGCVAGADANGFPRYVWGFHEGRFFQARHRTDPPGNRYKGWWLNSEERPEDPDGRLERLRETLGVSS